MLDFFVAFEKNSKNIILCKKKDIRTLKMFFLLFLLFLLIHLTVYCPLAPPIISHTAHTAGWPCEEHFIGTVEDTPKNVVFKLPQFLYQLNLPLVDSRVLRPKHL